MFSILENKAYSQWIGLSYVNCMFNICELCMRILQCYELGVLEPEFSQLEEALDLFCSWQH
jgi:hypothetical protein